MNVVLVNLDSLRKDHLGAYGNRWIQPPALDAFARESLRFTDVGSGFVDSVRPRLGLPRHLPVDRRHHPTLKVGRSQVSQPR